MSPRPDRYEIQYGSAELVIPVPQPDPEHLFAVLDDEGWIEVPVEEDP